MPFPLVPLPTCIAIQQAYYCTALSCFNLHHYCNTAAHYIHCIIDNQPHHNVEPCINFICGAVHSVAEFDPRRRGGLYVAITTPSPHHPLTGLVVYADWCGPCKAIAPFYATLASKYSKPSAVVFTKINTDEQRSVTQTYNVSAMPTFIVFKSGREVSRIRGADPKALEAAVKGAVADVSSFEGSGRKLGDAVESAPKKTGLVEKGAGIGRPYVSNGRAVSRFVV